MYLLSGRAILLLEIDGTVSSVRVFLFLFIFPPSLAVPVSLNCFVALSFCPGTAEETADCGGETR